MNECDRCGLELSGRRDPARANMCWRGLSAYETERCWERACEGREKRIDNLERLIASLKLWLEGRITECRRVEAKFGAANPAIDSAPERMVLQALLEKLMEVEKP